MKVLVDDEAAEFHSVMDALLPGRKKYAIDGPELATLDGAVVAFTDAIIGNASSDKRLETIQDIIQGRFEITQEELVEEVHSQLLLLAQFCSCRSGVRSCDKCEETVSEILCAQCKAGATN